MPSERLSREPDPVTEGELATDAARVIRAAIRVALYALPPLLLLTAWYRPLRETVMLALLLAAVAVLHLLVRSGRAAAALHGLVFALMTYGVGAIVAYGSMRSVGALGFVAAIVVSGMFLRPAALVAVAAACIASIGALIYAEHSGAWPRPDFQAGPQQWLVHSVVLSAIAFIMYYARSLVLSALRRARAEVAERERAETALLEDITERKRAEAALRASEERWERLFRASPVAMIIGDFDRGVLLDINRAAEVLTGMSERDAVGQPLSIFYSDPAQREEIRRRLEAEGRLSNYPTTYRRPGDGSLVSTITSLELIEEGGRRCSVAIVLDMTAETQARAELRRSEERFSKAFFSLPVNLAITRRSDGAYIEVNNPPEHSLGYTREEMIGRTSTEMGIWIDDAERDRALACLQADGRLMAYEARLRHKSGEIADCEIWATQIELEGVPCVLSSTLNVTERKREEALIRDVARGVAGETGEGFFARLVEHFARALRADSAAVGEIVGGTRMQTLALMQDGVARAGIDYPIEGTSCEAVIQVDGLRIYGDRVAEKFPRFGLLREVGARGYIGGALRDADGTPIGVLAAAYRQPLGDTSRVEPLFRIFAARAQAELLRLRREREILCLNETLEQRVRERTLQLEAAVRELEAFSYSVSHDLRAPLRAIVRFAHMLIEEDGQRLSDESRRKLEVVERNALRMGRLIDELMQLARVQRAEVRREPLDLRSTAIALADDLRPRYPAASIEIGELPAVHGDPTLVPQVLANLLDNGCKFSERSSTPRVELGWSGSERACYVRDNGIGFDMQYAGKLFGTFERLHSERDYPGTGIGLAIVKRIVERHGGRAWAVAEPGRGATFYFTLEGKAP